MADKKESKTFEQKALEFDIIKGTRAMFGKHLFGRSKYYQTQEYNIIDWRWGSVRIYDREKHKPLHPVVNFLIKREGMVRSRWTSGFPVRDVYINEEEDL